MNYDFYTQINKEWIKNNKIPPTKSSWSHFNILHENNLHKLKYILNLISNNKYYNNINILYNQKSTNNDYFEYIEKINNISTISELLNLMFEYQLLFNTNNPIIFDIESDFNNSNNYILHINTGGLGLPNKNYYFKNKNIKEKYKIFMKNYSLLFNLNLDVDKIYYLEELIATKTHSNEEKQNLLLINNIRTLNEVIFDYPNLYFNILIKKNGLINISNPKYLKSLNELLVIEILPVWKEYFKWIFILSIYQYLSDEIEETYLNFYKKELLGVKILEEKWKRRIYNVEKQMGDYLGLLYVKKFFNKKIKYNIKLIFNYIMNEIKESIINNDWMENDTKKKALIKLKNIIIKIGYPKINTLPNYNNLVLSEKNSYFKNNLLCNKFKNDFKFNKLYTNVNKNEWHMFAHSVNAYYNPSYNEIVIPAGILQPPFYNKNNIAKNFGGIGYIIGHEIIHGFDNLGRHYDEFGNVNKWWSNKDDEQYKIKTKLLIEQYSTYKINNEFINGELTQNENIADLGGVKFALNALIKYSNNKNIIDFFINFAHIFASNITDKNTLHNIFNDYHSPHKYRVNGTLENIEKFYEYFNIPKTKQIITIW